MPEIGPVLLGQAEILATYDLPFSLSLYNGQSQYHINLFGKPLYRHIRLQWHQLPWHPAFSECFGKSHVNKKRHSKQMSACSDTFPLFRGCHCNRGCLYLWNILIVWIIHYPTSCMQYKLCTSGFRRLTNDPPPAHLLPPPLPPPLFIHCPRLPHPDPCHQCWLWFVTEVPDLFYPVVYECSS